MKLVFLEDNPVFFRFLDHILSEDPDLEVSGFQSAPELWKAITAPPDILVLDYSLPDTNGAEILARFRAKYARSFVVIVSGQEDVETAVDLLNAGAHDYVVKNDHARERLLNTIQHIKRQISLQEEVNELRQRVAAENGGSVKLLGESKPMKTVRRLAGKAAESMINVQIQGETGTGKEVVANCIHQESSRHNRSFVAINVAALPPELAESELFGHEKGAFTGATARRKGCFERANGGTLFLDEIGEMEPGLQAKLLRALQERQVMRLGGETPVEVDVRLISATNRDLLKMVQEGHFREDLYYRLMGLTIELPPLRERGRDVLLIAKEFLAKLRANEQTTAHCLSPAAQKCLLNYPFPGNIRELRAVIERAAILADSEAIQPEDLALEPAKAAASLPDEELTLKEYTDRLILKFLERYDGDVMQVARKLDIGKSTIYRLLKAREAGESAA